MQIRTSNNYQFKGQGKSISVPKIIVSEGGMVLRGIMVSLLMLVVLVFASPIGQLSTPPEVLMNDLVHCQGDVLVVAVTDVEGEPKGTFSGTPVQFQEQGGRWVALYGISYWTEPGTYPLKIQLPNGDQVVHQIRITQGDFKESHLTISQEQSKIVNPKPQDVVIIEQKKRDKELVVEAYSFSHPKPLWNGSFIRPTEGRVTTGYGYTRYVNGKLNNRHSGLDIANQKGTPIYAVNDGQVRLATELLVTGNTIIIDHGAGLYSSYSHLEELHVQVGDKVVVGQQIGTMGSTGFSTGSHLHWVMKIGNAYLNPDYFVGTNLLENVQVLIP